MIKESANAHAHLLDLFSTSQTSISEKPKCIKRSPLICIPDERGARLYQACCNDWLCPRCGQLRAKYEYGRIVEGARKLAKQMPLHMMTVTCRGDITVEESEAGYLGWTNRFNTNVSTYAKRKLGYKPEYAAVIERQPGRGHLHTHYLTTFLPDDAYFITDHYEKYVKDVYTLNAEIPKEMRYSPDKLEDIDNRQMFSLWLARAVVSAGLGVQVRLAVCDVIEGASRYIAKYLFKDAQFTKMPKGLRRVRYSRGWPKMPQFEATGAFVVKSANDWHRIANLGRSVECYGREVFERALNWRVYDAFYLAKEGEKIDINNYEPNL